MADHVPDHVQYGSWEAFVDGYVADVDRSGREWTRERVREATVELAGLLGAALARLDEHEAAWAARRVEETSCGLCWDQAAA
jgi:hypothetical protein